MSYSLSDPIFLMQHTSITTCHVAKGGYMKESFYAIRRGKKKNKQTSKLVKHKIEPNSLGCFNQLSFFNQWSTIIPLKLNKHHKRLFSKILRFLPLTGTPRS